MPRTYLSHTDFADCRDLRAEDQPSQPNRWALFCEGVLVPLGSIFGIFLMMLGVMLIAD